MPKRYLFFISQNYSYPVLRPLEKVIKKRGDRVKWFMYGAEVQSYRPDAVFVPGNVVPSFFSGLKVQVFHGLPSTKVKKNGQIYHYIVREMFDLYCTQGKDSTKKFQALAQKYASFLVKETGWSKLDPLFPLEHRQNKETKSIFFASTFSPRFSKAEVLYPFILEMIQKYNYHWYITLHPKMDSKIVALYKAIEGKNVKFVESIEVIEYFKKSDIMLCDTSSIIYEFSTQNKPVITFQTEKEEALFINVKELERLEEILIKTLEEENIKDKNNHLKDFHPYIDGKSSERVLDTVESLLSHPNLSLKKKPINLVRNFKLRKALNYWKF
ncbi:CDP-glycerol: N-acetyl-beta-D-mannosaminyl-1,4-N-acetyl-D-glucosaminyldiphosphoundecaprenyl glycerophosphotransferase [hydrothermal vent metagenome]|uniref:CDP-glycerol: N-acetyl-beta-D-mannosaminyl-1,4-N-acetyl-D-glucosaminyldiphosphoundecaprenyl glycerophosphotransferase n=1 Tax=hydrothermal vent metagenome TaxID=652676 RepID=A0A1W1D092_9ZZZZ